MRTTRPFRSPRPSRRSPLFAALAAALTAQGAFAACPTAGTGPLCVTKSVNDGLLGSLNFAVNNANINCGTVGSPKIEFDIPGTGPFVIAVPSGISFTCGAPLVSYNPSIDGSTQPGYTPNTYSTGFNSAIQIVIDGSGSSAFTGISAQSFPYGGSLTIKGVEVRNFTYGGFATALAGSINISGSRVTNNATGLNVRGIDPDGFGAPFSPAAVGTAATADRNVFRSNSNANVEINSPGFVNVTNNFIGTNDAGTTAAGGNGIGVRNSGWPNVAINGNVIGGSSANAVNATGSANTVTGNKIGVSLFGAALANGGSGIEAGSFPVFIGNNTIANNGLDGVTIPYGGSQVEIRGNRIHSNGRKAINLGGVAGPVLNDANDTDSGPNALQNHPVINSVIKSGGNTTINWSLNSITGTQFDIDFFSNPAAAAQPEGTAYLDPLAFTFTPGPAGGNTGTGNSISGTTTIGGLHDFITATATNFGTGETSEHSPYALATGAALSPTSIDFGNIVVNASSSPANATLTSLGASALNLTFVHGSNLCYGGPPAPPPICSTGGFICSTTCAVGTPYSNGQSCGFTATFAPTFIGSQSTTIYICDNAGGNPRTLTLTGTAIAPPPPTVTPSSHSFGNVEVGTSSAVQNFVISNPSPTSITLSAITVPAPFALVANTCGGSIAANSSCNFDARFNAVAGAASASITATASSGPISIPVTGNGTPPPPPTFTPPSINFGSVQLGASSTNGTFTVTNPALTPVTLSAFTTSAPFSLVSTTCGASLPPSGTCTADVKFTPAAAGPASGALSNASGNGTVSGGLSGTGTASPPSTIAPLTHEFGSVFVGTSSGLQTFTINNPALLPATLGPITVTAPFALFSTTCTSSLAAQSSCTADVKFTPVSVGPASGSVSATTSSGTLMASLSGTGAAAPLLTITPPSHNFGSVLLGTSSATQAFTVKNPGPVALSISPLVVTGPFQLVSTTCGTSIASLGTCDASLRYTPTLAGAAAGELKATSSFGTSSANLTGNGIRQPAVELATAPIEFGSLIVGSPPVQHTLRLTNTGNDILGINSISIARPFTLANACGVSLAPGDSCTFTVSFDPTEIGDFAQNLAISTNAPNASAIGIRVHAQVQARPEPLVRASPRTIGFGGRMGNTQSPSQRITLTNEGGVAANLNLALTSPHFVILNTSCGATLAPRNSCTTDVAFQPQGYGPKQGQYVVTSNSPDSPIRVDLSGAGCRPVETTQQGRGTPLNNCAP